MGAKKYLTLNDMTALYGWSKMTFYRRIRDLDAALVKINGRAIKPYRFDADVLSRLISASPEVKPSRSLKIKGRKISESRRPIKQQDEDESWL